MKTTTFHASSRAGSRRGPAAALLVLTAALAACGDASSSAGPGSGDCLRDDDCDDRVDCTEDVCGVSVNGVRRCEHVPRTDRCDGGSECLATSALGAGCIERVALWCAGRGEGDACTPDDACGQGDGTCTGGRCTYPRKECAPAVCLVSRGCSASTGRCEYGPEPDGTTCDTDGLACSSEACVDGQCQPVTSTCECSPGRGCAPAPDNCHLPPRCVDGSCVYDPVECPPDEACRQFACDPADGACRAQPVREGESCDDGLACTDADACRGGKCAGSRKDCKPGSCRTASCVEPAGCVYGLLPKDAPCDDGNRCNGPDACLEGACRDVGPAVDCDDGDACTADACRPADGGCDHVVLPDCCGNSALESGERCDPGPVPVPLCRSCGYATADLSMAGSAPAVSWWPAGRYGLVAWEEWRDGANALEVRPLDADGHLGSSVSLPGISPGSDGRFHPALGTLSEGRFLLAFYTTDGIGLRLLGPGGAVLGQAVVTDADLVGTVPGRRLVIATMDGAALIAWQILEESNYCTYGKVRAVWVITANDSLLASLPATIGDGGAARSESSRLGTLCMGNDGAVVTLVFRNATQTIQQVAFHGTDGKVQAPRSLAAYADDLPMAPACASTSDGTFLAAVLRPVKTGEFQGFDVSAMALDAAGAPVGSPWSLVQSLIVPGAPVDLVFPSLSALDRWGDGYLLVATWIRGDSAAEPASFPLQAVSTTGKPGSAGVPLPIEGASDGFTVGLDVTPGPDGAILLGWHRLEHADLTAPAGVIKARFLAPP